MNTVQLWLKRDQLEPSLIPPRPGLVLASSLNSTMGINIQRAAVGDLGQEARPRPRPRCA